MVRALIIVLLFALPLPAADDAAGREFYEKKIRPVLAEHCFQCHSAEAEQKKKLKGGLRLDSREAMLAGGDSGPAIVAGKADESLLLKAMRYDGEPQMPPDSKLSDAVIADVAKWIGMGAPAPAGAAVKKQTGLSIEEGRKFWAYQPLTKPRVPSEKDTTWSANDIDRFILAKLGTNSLAPSNDAAPAVLLRRLHFDLTGLPPTPQEIADFEKDPSPQAYERIVDHLLASPEFGERWGRHWLDVARYADSVTLRGFIFKEAWRYRDGVIEQFNADRPFNAFIREQIAGDLLPAGSLREKQRQTIATTFLLLGNTNLEEQDKKALRMDVVDEQLDVITKGFLAQTVTCARCHDHKFDPIPTRDYYAMAGILRNAKSMEHANVSKWVEVPLPVDAATEAALLEHESKVKAFQTKLAAAKKKSPKADGVIALKNVPGIVVDDAAAKQVGEWKHSVSVKTYVGDGYLHDDNTGKGEKTLTFAPDLPANGRYEVRLAYIAGNGRSDKVPVHIFSADGEKDLTVNMKEIPPVDGHFLSLGVFRFEKAGQSFVIVSNEGTMGHVTADCVAFIPVADDAEPVKPAKAVKAGATVEIETELKRLQSNGPTRPMAMAPVEEKTVEDCRVHIRGNVHNLGDTVPRGVLSVVPLAGPAFPKASSGRVELANWIADDRNPLTSRVIVNRTWHWLMGAGIVRTVDNFGTTGEHPSHPELLDHLASNFVADGWSMKKLIRSIVLSRTYRQTIGGVAAGDPDNRLLSRMNRKRLDAESLRDTMLAVSGQLSHDRGGPGFPASLAADYNFKQESTRRSVYLPVFRNSLPDVFEAFDFANPSLVVGARNVSTVAPQALFLMNHPFVREQAKATARRLMNEASNDNAKLTFAYRLTLGRMPTEGERAVAMKHLVAEPGAEGWTAIIHALFASADFRYLD